MDKDSFSGKHKAKCKPGQEEYMDITQDVQSGHSVNDNKRHRFTCSVSHFHQNKYSWSSPDPYAHVSFLHVSKTTEVIRSTLNPTWDQTLIFENIEIHGDPQTIARNPPDVVLELYDSDQVVRCKFNPSNTVTSRPLSLKCAWFKSRFISKGRDEPLGRCTCPPVVKLNPSVAVSPKLLWFPVTKKGCIAGEVLLAAELLLKNKVSKR